MTDKVVLMKLTRLCQLVFSIALPILFVFGCAMTPALQYLQQDGTTATPICSIEQVTLNGVPFWISIRGNDVNNPIILFLHGGPGTSEMIPVRYFLGALERNYVVVNWDQRGAGKSYWAGVAEPSKMTVAQFVEDAKELAVYLEKRFHHEKIFVVGHSWGSMLGILTVGKYPELFFAYAGIGQFVNGWRNEQVSYAWTLAQARKDGNDRAVRELEALAPYPKKIPVPSNPNEECDVEFGPYGFHSRNVSVSDSWIWELLTERNWLVYYGGGDMQVRNAMEIFTNIVLQAPENTLFEKMNFMFAEYFSVMKMWPECLDTDLETVAPDLQVPVYLFIGRYDYQTPWPVSQKYFEHLKAPVKKWFWFENSAHSPCFEEPELFCRLLGECFTVPK